MIKQIGYKIFEIFNVLSFYSLKKSGYLKDKGWFLSFKTKNAIDNNNQAIPWMTYSFIDFLTDRLQKDFKVFEFGSGNSTIWWGGKVAYVIAVESDKTWYDRVEKSLPTNTSVKHLDAKSSEYSDELLNYLNEFNIISIDGMDRVNFAKNSINALTKDGVVIWDNSDREEYKEGYDFLIKNGFKRLDFHGLGPINVMSWTTSVFYRPENCLGI